MSFSRDPLAPSTEGVDAFAGPLACITLITRFPAEIDRFYGGLMEMTRFAETSSDAQRDEQRELWGLPEAFEWEELLYCRPGLPDVPMLRVLSSAQAGDPVRPGLAARSEGGLSIGFAMRDLDAVVARGAEAGFETTAGVGALDMRRADGSPYQALECHFRAPDDVFALGVSRPPDLAPVGPIEADASVGGPAYSGQVMNHCEATLRFYTEVLGYEVRRDMEVGGPVAEKGLGLPPGMSMRFLQVFAPGSTSGYFIVLDFGTDGEGASVAAPASGVVMWTFPVADVERVASQVGRVGCEVVAGPKTATTPYFGSHRAVTVRTANGFVVECIERD